jgi:hypothetical protein
MAEFLVYGVGCVSCTEGGTEKGYSHRAEAQFLACTLVRFARSPFTEPRARGVFGGFTSLLEVAVRRDGVVLCVCEGGAALAPQFTT